MECRGEREKDREGADRQTDGGMQEASLPSVSEMELGLLTLSPPGGKAEQEAAWWLVAGSWWLVVGGLWLVVGGWWLVVGGWWLLAGGWW